MTDSDCRTWVLGTRGSLLATTQSRQVAAWIEARSGADRVELKEIRTEGDRLQTVPLAPGEKLEKGLFTSALEDALVRGDIDLAVHSLKDVPTQLAAGLRLAAIPLREDPRDAFLSNGPSFTDLPAGSVVATGSPRRAFQLRLMRPDLSVVPVRGNVDTRIGKLRAKEFDGIVLALSGLRRLGRDGEVTDIFEPLAMLPAPGQGALALETRDDSSASFFAGLLDDEETRCAVNAERAVLTHIGGGCNLPLGTYARHLDGELKLDAILFSEDGERHAREQAVASLADAEDLGRRVAASLLARLSP